MGGGKGAIDHYVTPIKAGRVIVEMGGTCEFAEVKHLLTLVSDKLPFKAMVVSQKMMDDIAEEQKKIEEENLNPYTFKYVVQNNMGGCRHWTSPVDSLWFGKYV